MSLLRRPGLLLSAAVTLTVPGVLAVLAVLGHEHAAFEARSEAVSLGSSAPPASMPVESLSAAAVPTTPAAPAAVRDAAAEMEKISGLHAAAFGAGLTRSGHSAFACSASRRRPDSPRPTRVSSSSRSRAWTAPSP